MAVAVLMLVAACGGDDSSSTGDSSNDGLREFDLPYTIYNSLIADLPIAVALEKDFFADHGLAPNVIPTKGGGASVRAFMASDAPLGVVSTTSAIPAAVAGEPLRIVGRCYNGTTYRWLATEGSGITELSADQLRGKRFAITTPGGASDSQVSAILEQVGIDRDEIEVVPGGDDSGITILFDEERVDIAPIGEVPAAERIEAGAPLLILGVDTIKGFFSASLAAKEDTLENDPELIRDFVGALDDAQEWILQNPTSEELVDIAMEKLEATPDDRTKVESVISFYVENADHWWDFRLADADVQTMVDLLVSQGDLEEPVDDLSQVMSTEWEE